MMLTTYKDNRVVFTQDDGQYIGSVWDLNGRFELDLGTQSLTADELGAMCRDIVRFTGGMPLEPKSVWE
jgi:hypothetical protein